MAISESQLVLTLLLNALEARQELAEGKRDALDEATEWPDERWEAEVMVNNFDSVEGAKVDKAWCQGNASGEAHAYAMAARMIRDALDHMGSA